MEQYNAEKSAVILTTSGFIILATLAFFPTVATFLLGGFNALVGLGLIMTMDNDK